jgi:hypothetical protein
MHTPTLAGCLALALALAGCGITVVVPETSAGSTSGSTTGSTSGGPISSSSSGAGGAGGSAPEPPLACPGTAWSRGFGDAVGEQYPLAVVIDRQCNVVVAGMAPGPIDVGAGVEGADTLHFVLLKLDSQGNYLWSRQLPAGAYWAFGKGLAVGADGAIVLAGILEGKVDFGGGTVGVGYSGSSDDLFVASFDADGNHLWSKAFHGSVGGPAYVSRDVLSVAVGPNDEVVLAGYSPGTLDFGEGPLPQAQGDDMFVARFDAAGELLSTRMYGGPYDDKAWGIAVAADGGTLVLGSCAPYAKFGGAEMSGDYGACLGSFSPSGAHLWTRLFPGGGNLELTGFGLDAAGDIFIAGFCDGSIDWGGGPVGSSGSYGGFLVKLDAAGELVWSHAFDGAFVNGLAVSQSGAVALTGSFAGSLDLGGVILESSGEYDVFVASFDAAGKLSQAARFGDAESQRGFGVAIDGVGSVFVSGSYAGHLDLGSGALPEAGPATYSFVGRL